MSYRELRDFTEHMKTLGYPSSLSHASFRQPNFPLVASCLLFLLRRYDPTLITADDISTQQARVTFIQSITQLLWSKCNVKLSMKQLYRADGYAVKEMLKLSAVLYAAMAANTASAVSGTTAAASTSPLAGDAASGVPASLDAFKAARSLATMLIDTADRLSELLGKEGSVRVARDTAIAFVDQLNETSSGSTASSSNSSSNNVERHIKRQLQLIADNTSELKQLTTATTSDVDKQRTKLERKSQERDRLTKRWQALRRVKPAFMEEYEREEKELRLLYGVYVERVRNVRWLEDEMREMRLEEEEERKERERQRAKLQKRMKEEERRMLRGEGEEDEDDGSGEDDEEDDDEEEDDEEADERDEKRMYERKDRAGDEDDEDEDDEEGEGDEEEDEDELDSENEHKRPARRPPQKQPASAAIMKGRDSRGGGGGGAGGGGGGKGRAVSKADMELGSESDGSAMGDDDYF